MKNRDKKMMNFYLIFIFSLLFRIFTKLKGFEINFYKNIKLVDRVIRKFVEINNQREF